MPLFTSGKMLPQKRKKKHGIAYIIILIFTMAIEAMLGINAAFLVDQSLLIVMQNMLSGTPFAGLAALLALAVSLVVGFCLMLGGMWTFSGFMDTLEDAKAFTVEYGTHLPWPVTVVWLLAAAVIGIDFTTLFFRSAYFSAKGETSLFWFFVILIFTPFVLGALIHVIEHTPNNRKEARVRHYAESVNSDRLEEAVQRMDPDLLDRLVSGDRDGAIAEHYQRVEQMRQDNQAFEQERMAERSQKQQKRSRPF